MKLLISIIARRERTGLRCFVIEEEVWKFAADFEDTDAALVQSSELNRTVPPRSVSIKNRSAYESSIRTEVSTNAVLYIKIRDGVLEHYIPVQEFQ